MRIEPTFVNRFVRVHFKDTGCADGICTFASAKNQDMEVLLGDGTKQNVEADQLVVVGPALEYPKF